MTQSLSKAPAGPAPAADAARVGGRYRIETVLAEGGMGSVYRVIDERSERSERGNQPSVLALKRMRGDEPSEMLALFEREYRTLSGIEHPRIIRVYDYGVDTAGPYYTMELVEGQDLHELAPVPLAQACRHLRDVATCLALLHTRRLLHRDVTPRNVRVLPSGECKLLDFGALMSFGIPERMVGTPPCMPPESLRRAPLDQRSDIFSFGALMYWTLTRKHAYPARHIEDLPQVWRKRPQRPSKLVPGLPAAVDALVMSALSLDPLARPATMAEIVERLNVIGELPPEDAATQRALADSYLVQADFVGREQEREGLHADLSALDEGRGSATLVIGPSGVGRSRLLREVVVQAQLLGVPSLHVDASVYRQSNGCAVAIVRHLLDASAAARREAQSHAASLAQLDPSLAGRLQVIASAPRAGVSGDWRARMQELLLAVVAAACSEGRLLLVVDNVDEADEGSLALLAGLLRLTSQAPLLLLCSARSPSEARPSISWRILSERSKPLLLAPLSDTETLSLARSLFGAAPNLARFAEWLHERSGGLPLHFMELVRRLHTGGVIRYLDGLWALPAERPAHADNEGLTELLAQRFDGLSAPARALAEALAIQRSALERERCIELARVEGPRPLALLDELVRALVLEDSLHGYQFMHGALREVLNVRMSPARRTELHLRCAEAALARAQGETAMFARIEAGWHLLQAGEDSRGADVLAEVTYDTVGVRFAFADLQVAAPALEAALGVYTRQGRSIHERMPLMAALAQAGYYEDRIWGERYGEAALTAVEEVSGLRLAKQLVPVLGKTLGLVCALSWAALRFRLTRGANVRYRYRDVLVQLFGVVTTLTGAASMAFDVARAERIAGTLAPFLHLPQRLTPVGIGQFCAALKEIGREHQAQAVATWTTLIERFDDPTYYPTLPVQARALYVGGLWFARGVFETFRDGRGGLEAADALDGLGLKLYGMIASALRSLHYVNRGQLEQAAKHREQVDVHAVQIGSAWQVELWEPAALILAYATLGDVVEMRRITDRLVDLARTHPALERYARFAELATAQTRNENASADAGGASAQAAAALADETLAMIDGEEPRSFTGWGAVYGYVARQYNMLGRHAEARTCAERALSQLTAADRPFVALFLTLEIERALAEVGLGDVDGGRERLRELLAFHAASDNPLTRGRLHEASAFAAAAGRDWPSYQHHLAETRSWFRGTGTPVLIARLPRLEALDPKRSMAPPANGATVRVRS